MSDPKGSNLSKANRIAAGIEEADELRPDTAGQNAGDASSEVQARVAPNQVDEGFSPARAQKRGIGWTAATLVTPVLFFFLFLLMIAWLDSRGSITSPEQGQDLGVAVKVETSPDLQRSHGQLSFRVTVTNIRRAPVMVNEVIFNGSSKPYCALKPNRSLDEGGSYTALVYASFQCGNIIRVSVKTDRGERDFLFEP